jgi:hypothetical protein
VLLLPHAPPGTLQRSPAASRCTGTVDSIDCADCSVLGCMHRMMAQNSSLLLLLMW